MPWPARRDRRATDRANVAAVVVNFNTRALIAQLVFSLCRLLGRQQLAEIVVVDNGSHDGSVGLLEALDRAGLIHLVANGRQRYHGPALNQGISWLAERQGGAPHGEQIDYVWVVDSDVVVLRPDTIHDAVAALEHSEAALLGQSATLPHHEHEMLGVYSLLLDPAVVWRAPIPPFREHGEPSAALQVALRRHGCKLTAFPFVDAGYVLHLGRGTLASVATAGARRNRYFAWATEHNEPHYAGAAGGHSTHAAFLELFERELPEVTPEALVDACGSSRRLALPRCT